MTDQSNASTPPPSPKKKKSLARRLLGILLILVILLLLLVLLTPTLLSTSPGRNFILGKANQQVAGKIEASDISVGWFTPASLRGVKIYDPDGKLVVAASQVSTQLTVLGAISDAMHPGKIVVHAEEVHLRTEPDGQLNLQRALASRSPSKPAETQESKPLPKAAVELDLAVDALTWDAPQSPTLFVENLRLQAKTDTSGAAPTTWELAIPRVRSGNRPAAEIASTGEISAFADGKIKPPLQMTGKADGAIKNFDLESLNPILRNAKMDLTTGGQLDTDFKWKAATPGEGDVKANLTILHLKTAGAMLKGNDFTSEVTTSAKLDASWTPQQQITVRDCTVRSEAVELTAKGTASREVIDALLKNQPAPDANFNLQGNINLASLLRQIPTLARLQPGTKIQQGTVKVNGSVTVSEGNPSIKLAVLTDPIRGTQDIIEKHKVTGTRRIGIEALAIQLEARRAAGVVRVPVASILMPADIAGSNSGQTLNFQLQQDAANAQKLTLNGKYDLDRLYQQLRGFVDFGDNQFGGTGQLNVTTNGDWAKQVQLTFLSENQDLRIAQRDPEKKIRTLTEPTVRLQGTGNLTMDAGAPKALDVNYTLTTDGLATAPSRVQAQWVKQGETTALTVPVAEVNLRDVNLAKVVERYKNFVPALADLTAEGHIASPSGLKASMVGDDVKVESLNIVGTDVVVRKAGSPNPLLNEMALSLTLSNATLHRGTPQTLEIQTLSAASSVAQLASDGPIKMQLADAANPMTLEAVLKLTSNLATATPALAGYGAIPAGSKLQGNLNLKLSAKASGGATHADIVGTVPQFQMIASGTAKPLPPTDISLALHADYDGQAGSLTFSDDSVVSEKDPAKGGQTLLTIAKGSKLSTGTGPMDLSATADYDLARLTQLLAAYLPEGTDMQGARKVALKVHGAMGAGAGLKKLQSLEIEPTSIGWDRIALTAQGIELGKTDIPIALKGGVLPLGDVAIPFNGGSLGLGGRVDLNAETPTFITDKQLNLAQKVGINGKFGGTLLQFLPLTWGVPPEQLHLVALSGTLDSTLQPGAHVPLAYEELKKSGTLAGSLSMNNVTAETPIWAMIGQSLQQANALGLKIGEKGRDLALRNQSVPNMAFTLEKGRIVYHDLKLAVQDYGLNFNGAVSLEKQIDMKLDVVTPQLKAPIPLAISGTTAKPQLKLGEFKAENVQQTIEQAVPAVLDLFNKKKK